MLPLILLLLVQGISAVEFPDLASHISVIWDNVNISSQINADQTMSVNGTVPIFTLCGFKNSRGFSADCSIKYQSALRYRENNDFVLQWDPPSNCAFCS